MKNQVDMSIIQFIETMRIYSKIETNLGTILVFRILN